jgi:uncharacterized protein RhaS with RHS repeats
MKKVLSFFFLVTLAPLAATARYYHPALGRYLSVDPLVASTGDPYAYAQGNPLVWTDPTGQIITVNGVNVMSPSAGSQIAAMSPAANQAFDAVLSAMAMDPQVQAIAQDPSWTASVTTSDGPTQTRTANEDTNTNWNDARNQSESSQNGWDYDTGRAMAHEMQHAADQHDWMKKNNAGLPTPVSKKDFNKYTNKRACDKENSLGGNRHYHTKPGDIGP